MLIKIFKSLYFVLILRKFSEKIREKKRKVYPNVRLVGGGGSFFIDGVHVELCLNSLPKEGEFFFKRAPAGTRPFFLHGF